MKAKWKPVQGWESFYEVSNDGRVKSLYRRVVTKRGTVKNKKESILKSTVSSSGYHSVMLCVEGVKKRCYVHRIVALAFHKKLFSNYVVNHIDGNKLNNHQSNLEWVTIQENTNHAIANGLIPIGEKSTSSKLSKQKVLAILRLHRINPNFNKLKLSKKLNISDSTIHKIIKRQRWAHLNG